VGLDFSLLTPSVGVHVTIAVKTDLKACTAFVVARWREWYWRDALSVQIEAQQFGRLASGATGASMCPLSTGYATVATPRGQSVLDAIAMMETMSSTSKN
jgi:hypothetical protein